MKFLTSLFAKKTPSPTATNLTPEGEALRAEMQAKIGRLRAELGYDADDKPLVKPLPTPGEPVSKFAEEMAEYTRRKEQEDIRKAQLEKFVAQRDREALERQQAEEKARLARFNTDRMQDPKFRCRQRMDEIERDLFRLGNSNFALRRALQRELDATNRELQARLTGRSFDPSEVTRFRRDVELLKSKANYQDF